MFDVAKVRKDFPILEEQVYGKRLVYLDNGATTQRPLQVIEKMNEYYLKYNSNVHRGVHFLSNKCTDANEEAREIVRKFIHAGSDKEIIFTGVPRKASTWWLFLSEKLLSGKVTKSW